MPSTLSDASPLRIHYGRGEIEALARHRRVVLQPDHYGSAELATLIESGTGPLAYLALSEDTGPSAAWMRPQRNPDWEGRYVHLAHPAWVDHVLTQANAALSSGFVGLFLDTLDVTTVFPADRVPLLDLVRALRRVAGERYVLANRGFDLLPDLAACVDGFVFEGFSTTWLGGYRPLPHDELLANVEALHRVRATGRDLYALDYSENTELAAFARARARTHDLPLQVADRHLTRCI